VFVLQISQADDLDRVCAFLRSVHLDVREHEEGTITVAAPGARSPLHEQREIAGYVTTWNALNPASPIKVVEVP
jgi:hypothetical protein